MIEDDVNVIFLMLWYESQSLLYNLTSVTEISGYCPLNDVPEIYRVESDEPVTTIAELSNVNDSIVG